MAPNQRHGGPTPKRSWAWLGGTTSTAILASVAALFWHYSITEHPNPAQLRLNGCVEFRDRQQEYYLANQQEETSEARMAVLHIVFMSCFSELEEVSK